MEHVKSPLLGRVPGIAHGFGSRAEPLPAPFESVWEARRPRWQQVHGVDVADVAQPAQDCGKVDALHSHATLVPIAVMTADCVPILLARRDGGRVAAVHAGWRGTRAGILAALWERLRAGGERPADWVAAVGPSIGPCCYEVSPEIADDFTHAFASYGPGLAVPRTRYLDLPAINQAQLRELGLGDTEIVRGCTRCASDADGSPSYFSYRREGSGTRQWSVVMRTG